METKICCKCREEKKVIEFNVSKRNKDGFRGECKLCQKNYYLLNADKIRKQRIERYELNTVKELISNKKYYKKNKDLIINKLREKKQNNYNIRLISNLRSRLVLFVKTNKIHKDNQTIDLLGCSPSDLREHLEKQFKYGMSWDNYGFYGWHIDHIIPLSHAKNEEDLFKLCHYTNLQPLWSKDNLSKGCKIN
jgi:hypothetical protein